MSYTHLSGLGDLGKLSLRASRGKSQRIFPGQDARDLRQAIARLGIPIPVTADVDQSLANHLKGVAPRFRLSARHVGWYTKRKKGFCRTPPCLRVSNALVTAVMTGQAANVAEEPNLAETGAPGGGAPADEGGAAPATTEGGGMPWGLIAIGGVVVVGGIAALVLLRKKKAPTPNRGRRSRRSRQRRRRSR
jgi:hypothetical protein